MRAVSAEFLAALTGSHTMVSRATVITSWQTGTAPTGTRIDIHSGDIRLSSTAAIRGTLDLTTLAAWPDAAHRPGWLLAPYGNEIYLERGINYGNGQVEYVGQGYYRINSAEQTTIARDGHETPAVRISGSDRMAGIIDARLTEPRQFQDSDLYADVFDTLVGEVYPDAAVQFDDSLSSTPLGRQVICERDRAAFLHELADARGKAFYFDHRGIPVVRTPPSATSPVWTASTGANGVLIDLGREISREGVYNAVVATGEAADTTAPVRAVAIDNDPTSPTYYHGRFGKVPDFYSSPLIHTAAQAATAAAALLARVVGLPYALDLTFVPNVALEPWDPVKIRTPLGSETHVIRDLAVPLTAEQPMTAATRQIATTEGS